jgi:hypothetical protein
LSGFTATNGQRTYIEEELIMEIRIGKVIHYYNRIGVAVLSITENLKTGDVVHILGRTSDLVQTATSLEIEHHKVKSAGPGIEVALKVIEPVRKGDEVFKVVGEEAGNVVPDLL